MIKNLLFTVVLLLTTVLFATEKLKKQIKLEKHYKIENTFSGNLSSDNSFHLIFTKNKKTKKYEVFTYTFDGNKIEEAQTIVHEKPFSVVSFHKENDILTLLLSYDQKKDTFLKKVEININNKEHVISEKMPHDDFITSFREKNRSILIYKTNDALTFKNFSLSNTPKESIYTFTGKEDPIKAFFKDNSVVALKVDEFVVNGATTPLKAYLNNNEIVFTKDDLKKKSTSLINISIEKEIIRQPEIFSFLNESSSKKFKKHTSYFSNKKLFILGLHKKAGNIKIYDSKKKQLLNTVDINESLISKIKGNPKFSGIEEFLKNAGRNKYEPTITVNKTKTDNVKIRVDYVNKDYSYHYNWWWHHHQFMMWQNQMHMQNMNISVPSGFGPSQPNEIAFDYAGTNKENRFFELLVDSKGFVLEESLPESFYKEINKKEYVDELEKEHILKHKSSCFLKNSFRYIYYSKKNKEFIIKTKPLE